MSAMNSSTISSPSGVPPPAADPLSDVSGPSTPAPNHTAMARLDQIDRLSSPKPSTLADLASSPPLTASRANRSKYISPPPPSVSMTPPPSSQLLPHVTSPGRHIMGLRHDSQPLVARTPTPPSLLSSPPPSIAQLPGRSFDQSIEPSLALPDANRIADAAPSELRHLLQSAVAEVSKLRTNAAHYKLQHQLLTIETEEAAKRMAVEHEMTRREVQVLQQVDQNQKQWQQRDTVSPVSPPQPTDSAIRASMELKMHYLQADNDLLRRRLRHAKKLIILRDDENMTLSEDNLRLRKRIQENREHVNRLRRPGGLYEALTPRQTDPSPSTPQRQPIRTPTSSTRFTPVQASSRGSGEDTIEALLLADQVLSQESASARSTPARRGYPPRAQLGHTRGSQSLSSLQSTPRQHVRPIAALLPPVYIPITPDRSAPHSAPVVSHQRHRRRVSRDSTISASDAGMEEAEQDETDEEYDRVGESQASQLATSMLRRRSQVQPGSVRVAPDPEDKTNKSGGLLQTKLFGRVKKAGLDVPSKLGGSLGKRKHMDDDEEAKLMASAKQEQLKRMRANDGVGLGIESWRV